ncbi:MAG: hypothetical protein ACPGRX_08015, partial [Bdellovibrionales bacterium]
KAVRLVKKHWKTSPHPDFIAVWRDLMPQKAQGDALPALKWFETLVKVNPAQVDGLIAAGRAAMQAGLWGEAKRYFEQARGIEPSAALYRAFADLERQSGDSGQDVQAWLDLAAEAPAGKAWVCAETGRVYEAWAPIAQPHGSFNTMQWRVPYITDSAMLVRGGAMAGSGVFEIPKITA